MANKSFEITKPPVEEYQERFEALARVMTPENRDEILLQIDRVCDLYGADYPERITETKVELGMLALEGAVA